MPNSYIKESNLFIETCVKDGRTILKDSYFTAPFKITTPFYNEEDNRMKLCIMSVSPGMLEGDRYKIKYVLNAGSRLHTFSQSYNKVFSMKQDCAKQDIEVTIKDGASLEYYLYPTIPYKDSAFRGTAKFALHGESDLLYREIMSCGRYAMGEKFDFKEFSSKVSIYMDEKLIFFDNTHLEPKLQQLQDMGIYEGFTHAANVFIANKRLSYEIKKNLQNMLKEYDSIEYGISIPYEFIMVVRILGKSSDKLMKITDRLKDEISAILSIKNKGL